MLFLLYHYFAAAEMYNMIRVLIAAYVWMTGFNNFLYYYKTNDFSIVRSAPLPANERSSIRWDHYRCLQAQNAKRGASSIVQVPDRSFE